MKTITYHMANEIRIAMMIAIFATAIFTTIKVRELQVNEMNNLEMMRPVRTEVNQNSFPVLPVAVAELIEEPLYEAGTTFTANPEKELVVQIKTWMNNNTYWSDETTANKEELAIQMKAWMKDGDYWSKIAE